MAVNTTIASLSQTVALNGPDGAVDPPSSLDDSLRYHGAFIAQLRDGVGFTSATANALIAALTASAARIALGFAGGVVVDRAYAELSTYTSVTTIVPYDNTIPQNTEGTQLLSVSFTPKSTTNRIRLRFHCQFTTSVAATGVAALFSSASANALAATPIKVAVLNDTHSLGFEHEYVPGVTTALTFSVRVGPDQTATMYINGVSSTGTFGGVNKATLVIEEITP